MKHRNELVESSIDFPRGGLDPHVWYDGRGGFRLQPDVKKTILAVLSRYPGEDLLQLGNAFIVGSICSNQYADNADIDIHINPDEPERFTDENSTSLKKWFDKNRDKINGWIGQHPIEVYLQLNPKQDMLSDGVYDIEEDRWLKGPKIVDIKTNPYEDYKDLADEIRLQVAKADELFGELKRDVIDYEVIKDALDKMEKSDRQQVMRTLEAKLEEIEDDIQQLYGERGKWSDMRKDASKPESLEQAKNDIALAKNWEDKNAIFKFINRYKYMKVIGDLKVLVGDNKVSGDEVDKVKKIMGD